jgi:transcriptional regulator with XRE-family HTH domain
MSLTEVGEAAGVAPSAVMRFANGTRDLHLATATKICAALGMTLLQAARPARRAARPAARKNGG